MIQLAYSTDRSAIPVESEAGYQVDQHTPRIISIRLSFGLASMDNAMQTSCAANGKSRNKIAGRIRCTKLFTYSKFYV